MSKIKYNEFKTYLESLKKTYFTLYELNKVYKNKKSSLKNLLSRWTKENLIFSLGNGFYCFDLVKLDYLNLACNYIKPSYISFEYALNYYGMLDQISETITLTTDDRHRFVHMGPYTFEYTKINKNLFFDFLKVDNFYIASPEKALLDIVYLMSRNKRLIDLDNINLKKISINKLNKLAKKYPSYVLKKLRSVMKK